MLLEASEAQEFLEFAVVEPHVQVHSSYRTYINSRDVYECKCQLPNGGVLSGFYYINQRVEAAIRSTIQSRLGGIELDLKIMNDSEEIDGRLKFRDAGTLSITLVQDEKMQEALGSPYFMPPEIIKN